MRKQKFDTTGPKVYCKDCKYFINDCHTGPPHCDAPTGEIITDYVIGDHKERIILSSTDDNYPNKRDVNGCKYYKRKWWKMWI